MAIFDLSLVSSTQDSNPSHALTSSRWVSRIECTGPPFPPARIVGNSAHQLIPLLQGMCSLELDLSSDTSHPQITSVDKEHCHCGPYTRFYSRDTFSHFDDMTKEPFFFVFDTRPKVLTNDFPKLFSIAAPFIRPNELSLIFLDAYSSRLILRGFSTDLFICSFSRSISGKKETV